jgi:ribosome-binding protein aMBF1 (putative translation factor)
VIDLGLPLYKLKREKEKHAEHVKNPVYCPCGAKVRRKRREIGVCQPCERKGAKIKPDSEEKPESRPEEKPEEKRVKVVAARGPWSKHSDGSVWRGGERFVWVPGLHAAYIQSGLRWQQIADELGIRADRVSKYSYGTHRFPEKLLPGLARTLGVTQAYLKGEE